MTDSPTPPANSSRRSSPPAFDRDGQFYRGNLHCHSSLSDGALEPEEVIAVYKRLGYDFICLSDHFEAMYGSKITDTSPWRDDSFTTILGLEMATPGLMTQRDRYALIAVGLPLDYAPNGETDTGPEMAARAQQAGAFVALVHPGFFATRIGDVQGLGEVIDAVEIYNAGVQRANGRGDGWSLYEELLDQGHDLSCIASDDAHFQFDAYNAVGGAWIQVRSPSLDPDSLLAALKEGAFYSTYGPTISDVGIENREVTVECSPASMVSVVGPSWLQRHVSHRTWDGKPSDPVGLFGTIEEANDEGITRCRFSLDDFGPHQGGDEGGEWTAGDRWRVVVTDHQGRRAWTNPTSVGV
jgi:hypothetical protein